MQLKTNSKSNRGTGKNKPYLAYDDLEHVSLKPGEELSLNQAVIDNS